MRFMRWISLLAIAGSLAIGLPTAQAATTQQQQGVGEICVRAFNDINGDGTYTAPDEPLLANVTFILSNETGRIASYKTDGTEDVAYCFGNLAVGQYTVQARPDANKVKGKATTPGQWVVPLASGAQYDIAYGVNLGAQPESNQASAGSTSSGGMSTIGRIALGLLGIGVLGVAGFLAYSILRRTRSA
jgi:uncharacterized protein (DUF2141 family)